MIPVFSWPHLLKVQDVDKICHTLAIAIVCRALGLTKSARERETVLHSKGLQKVILLVCREDFHNFCGFVRSRVSYPRCNFIHGCKCRLGLAVLVDEALVGFLPWLKEQRSLSIDHVRKTFLTSTH